MLAVATRNPKYVDAYFGEMGVEDLVEKTILRHILLIFNRKAKPFIIEEINTLLNGDELRKAWNEEEEENIFPLKLKSRTFNIKDGFFKLYYSILTNDIVAFENWVHSRVVGDGKINDKQHEIVNDVYKYIIPGLIAVTKRRFGKGKFNETHKIGFSKFLNLPLETSEKLFEFLFSTITCDLQSLCEKSSKQELYKEIGYVANRLHVYFKEFALDASNFFHFDNCHELYIKDVEILCYRN